LLDLAGSTSDRPPPPEARPEVDPPRESHHTAEQRGASVDAIADPLTTLGIADVADPPWLAWVGAIGTETAQRITCDSVLYRVLVDAKSGQPLDVGRRYRTAPSWIRRALNARDQGCRWPGCDAPIPYTDGHHVTPWSEGGSTTVDDMLL